MGRPCVSGFPFFYYQYSISGGEVQGKSSILSKTPLQYLRHSAPPLPSYLIREYLHSAIQYWTVRQRVKPRTGEKQEREYPAAGLSGGFWEQAIPHKWGNSQQAGKSGCMGLVACLAGCRELLRPYARFQDVPTSGHVCNK